MSIAPFTLIDSFLLDMAAIMVFLCVPAILIILIDISRKLDK